MSLIDTPGSASANTYASVATADAYFATRPNSTKWTAVATTTAMKEEALQTATRLLDVLFVLYGDVVSLTQALRWPRYNVYDTDGRYISSTIIPVRVVEATCELALALLTKDRLKESILSKYGLTSFKIGPLSATAAEAIRAAILPDIVIALMQGYGESNEPNGKSPTFFQIERT